MLDGRYGDHMNRVWEFLARGLARAGFSPNSITFAGLVLVLAAAAAYPLHRDSLVFAVWLAVAFSFDGLDGAVARLTGRTSKFGGYFDAVIDRYQELAVLASIAWVHDAWPAALLASSGGLLTSYNKARAAMEIAIDNAGWPDLLERLERVVFIVGLLAIARFMPLVPATEIDTVNAGLLVLGALAHLTALQRFMRARRRIVATDEVTK
jgi:archaetidylinositol phosphate synthase